jgi:hypothetical protein
MAALRRCRLTGAPSRVCVHRHTTADRRLHCSARGAIYAPCLRRQADRVIGGADLGEAWLRLLLVVPTTKERVREREAGAEYDAERRVSHDSTQVRFDREVGG